jgi:Nucleoside 2-deoxyribosyltransferase like
MAVEIKAPGKYDASARYTVFLAGAIDQGKAEDWQKKVAHALAEFDINILNPRRDDWDSSWEQTADDPQFRQQVEWELDAQEAADMVVFVFTADSKAPITFLEFGLFATKKDAVVCVEEGFYRQGNLDIVAGRLKVPMYHNLDEMIADLQTLFKEKV